MLDIQDLEELLRLVADGRAQDLLLGALSKDGVTNRSVALFNLEVKLIDMKKKLEDDTDPLAFDPRDDNSPGVW